MTDAELAEYQVYFGEYDTWYTQALTSFYESARMVDLKELFYNGFEEVDAEGLTDAEQAYIDALYAESSCKLDTSRLPVEKMDQVLKQYFGLTMEEAAGIGLDRMPYWEETNSYYSYRGDTNSMKVTIHGGTKLENGNIALYYADDWKGDCMIVIRPLEKGANGQPDTSEEKDAVFQILSHVPLDLYDLFYQEPLATDLVMRYLELLDLRYPLRGETATGYEAELAQLPLAENSQIFADFANMSRHYLEEQKWRKNAHGQSVQFLTDVESVYEIVSWIRRGNQYEAWVKEDTTLYYAANTEWEAYDQWQVTQSHTILLERQPDGSLCLVSDQYHSQDDRLPCSVDCPSYKKYGVHIKGGGSIENLVDSYVKLWDLSFPLENQLPTIYWDLMEELPVVRSSNIYKDRQRFGQYYLEQNEEGDPILHKVKSVYQIESVEQVDDGYEVNVNIFTYMGYSYTENGCYTDVMGVGFPHVLRMDVDPWQGLRLLSDTYHVETLKNYTCSSDCTQHPTVLGNE